MILCLIGLFVFELLLLTASIIERETKKTIFELIMSFILASLFLLTIILFIPLFVTILERMRVAFPITYKNIKGKVTLGFLALMLLMFVRYLIYLSFQFTKLSTSQYFYEMPAYISFYVTELIISVAYVIFLVRVYRSKTIQFERERDHSSVNVDDH